MTTLLASRNPLWQGRMAEAERTPQRSSGSDGAKDAASSPPPSREMQDAGNMLQQLAGLQETIRASAARADAPGLPGLRRTMGAGVQKLLRAPGMRSVWAQADGPALRTEVAQLLHQAGITPAAANPVLAQAASAQRRGNDECMPEGEIVDWMVDILNNTQENYLDVYTDIASKYTNFYEKLSGINYASLVHTDPKDPNNVTLDAKKLRDQLNALLNSNTPVLHTFSTQAEAQEWAERIYGKPIPANTVKATKDASGKTVYQLRANTAPLEKMLADLNALGSGDTITVNAISFQAWESGYKIEVQAVQNMISQMATQLSHANSNVDNMLKIFTSCMTQLYEGLKAITRNMA
jgi:type III secretion system IpaD/SipD/SspD family effector